MKIDNILIKKITYNNRVYYRFHKDLWVSDANKSVLTPVFTKRLENLYRRNYKPEQDIVKSINIKFEDILDYNETLKDLFSVLPKEKKEEIINLNSSGISNGTDAGVGLNVVLDALSEGIDLPFSSYVIKEETEPIVNERGRTANRSISLFWEDYMFWASYGTEKEDIEFKKFDNLEDAENFYDDLVEKYKTW